MLRNVETWEAADIRLSFDVTITAPPTVWEKKHE
jgi:hypothetical protein